MELQTFIQHMAEQFEETDSSEITASTKFKDLDEYSSLLALTIIAMIDEEYDQMLAGATLRKFETVKELYDYVESL